MKRLAVGMLGSRRWLDLAELRRSRSAHPIPLSAHCGPES